MSWPGAVLNILRRRSIYDILTDRIFMAHHELSDEDMCRILDKMSHTEFLQRVSDAIDEAFQIER